MNRERRRVAAQRRCRQHATDAPVWVPDRHSRLLFTGAWYWELCWGRLRTLYAGEMAGGQLDHQVGWRAVGQVCTRCGHMSVDTEQVQALTRDDGCQRRERLLGREVTALGLSSSGP